jgi:hypothetical protein
MRVCSGPELNYVLKQHITITCEELYHVCPTKKNIIIA